MLVVTRFTIGDDDSGTFADRAQVALAALAARPGYRGGRIARSVDDASSWLITTEWDDMGSYRRSLSGYDVKLAATPLLAQALGEPSAYEVLYDDGPGESAGIRVSDRARDADTARVGETLAMGRETD
ncbi:MAG: antibiotic biosynthesis monooxygenase [Mycobacteriales bacterium]